MTGSPDPDPAPEVCDENLRPIVFMHGFLGGGDNFANQIPRFLANKYCPDRLFVFDWNSLADRATIIPLLDAFIDNVLSQTGATKIDLAGHSAGGGLGYTYLEEVNRAAKVEHFAYIGSSKRDVPAGPNATIPTVNIWSESDLIASSADIPGASNKQILGQDHFQIVTSVETFEAMFIHFNDGINPDKLVPNDEEQITFSGRVLTLGENAPQEGATIEVYEVKPESGERLSTTPETTLTTDASGLWGPIMVKKDTPYELLVQTTKADDRPIHYYREGAAYSNSLVYLRTFPSPTTLAGILVDNIPEDDAQSTIAIFSSSQAIIEGRDNFSVDDFDLATTEYATAERTNIAFFLFDDGDAQTSGNTHAVFNLFVQSFLTGIDYFIPTEAPKSISLKFNERTLNVPNLKSQTDGVIVAVFD